MKPKRSLWLLLALLTLLCAVIIANAQTNSPLYALPSANTPVFSSSTMALSSDGRTLVTANMLNDTLSIVDPIARTVLIELPIGNEPRAVALTPDNSRALVINRADGTLAVVDVVARAVIATYPVGVLPYAVVAGDNETAYITLQGEDQILQIEIATGRILQRLSVPSLPSGMALWGDFLYITHFWSGELTLIYLPQWEVVRTVSTGADNGLSQALLINPASGLAYLPQTRSNSHNPALTFDTVVFPVVNVVDLQDLGLQRAARITLDTADRPVNMPFAITFDSRRNLLYVVNAGSDDVSILDIRTGLAVGRVRAGANPRGILLSRDGSLAYVHNIIDGSLSIVDTRTFTISDVLPISDLTVSASIFFGAQLFYNATSMSQDGWISCASCHFDGLSDGRVWAGLGGYNTPVLFGIEGSAPYTWTGTWDELADLEHKIRSLHGGSGLISGMVNPPMGSPNAGLSTDLDDLVMYLIQLDSPNAPPSADPELAERGAALYDELNCASCHTGTPMAYDVGTGGEFITPTLNWLWLSQPYFHDGRAATLQEVFALPGAHQLIGDVPAEDIAALIAYLNTLPID